MLNYQRVQGLGVSENGDSIGEIWREIIEHSDSIEFGFQQNNKVRTVYHGDGTDTSDRFNDVCLSQLRKENELDDLGIRAANQ